jgi:hypothetical protein
MEVVMADQDLRKLLQLFYAGQIVDASANYGHFGITEQVLEKKEREQALAAPAQLAQLGIGTPAELFRRFSQIFGCASWRIVEAADGSMTAESTGCLACAIAKKRGSGEPCRLSCINPFRGMLQAMRPARALIAEETLWDGKRCLFRVS